MVQFNGLWCVSERDRHLYLLIFILDYRKMFERVFPFYTMFQHKDQKWEGLCFLWDYIGTFTHLTVWCTGKVLWYLMWHEDGHNLQDRMLCRQTDPHTKITTYPSNEKHSVGSESIEKSRCATRRNLPNKIWSCNCYSRDSRFFYFSKNVSLVVIMFIVFRWMAKICILHIILYHNKVCKKLKGWEYFTHFYNVYYETNHLFCSHWYLIRKGQLSK